MRLDLYLAENGYAKSRSEAQRLIREGKVTVDGTVCRAAAKAVSRDSEITVDRTDCRYVSRGGLKLETALNAFSIEVTGRVCLDIGASTGGFTDCLLQHGAKCVYAVENGHGQLDPTLLATDRVVSYEHYHAKNLDPADFPEPVTLAAMDVSFISQTLILPAVYRTITPGGILISLIKPQFEAGRDAVGHGGIVKTKAARDAAVQKVLRCAEEIGFSLHEVIPSPITGGDGNLEYLTYFVKGDSAS